MHEFALDAYEWVMVFNVYAMGTYGDGGRATRKPYVSSTAYLKRMSRETGGEWEREWNERWRTIVRH
jgi:deoxyribodipyrimidine photolyase-related protein